MENRAGEKTITDYSYDMLVFVLALFLLALGPDKYSMDRLIERMAGTAG